MSLSLLIDIPKAHHATHEEWSDLLGKIPLGECHDWTAQEASTQGPRPWVSVDLGCKTQRANQMIREDEGLGGQTAEQLQE